MKFRTMLIMMSALLGAAALAVPTRAETIEGGRFGQIYVSAPQGPIRGFMVLFSRLSGWTVADQQTADTLATHDLLVVGVDSGRYAATLAAAPETCHRLFNDVTAMSGQLQRERSTGAYFTPIVAGSGDGGRIAEQVLSSAPSNTIDGAISIDPAAASDPRLQPCPPDPKIAHDPGLPGFWDIGATVSLPASLDALAKAVRQAGAHVEIHHFGAGTSASAMLLVLSEPHLGPRAEDEIDVSNLPLIELPAPHTSTMLAIVVSGDGGWHDLDQTIARNLQNAGVAVVGIDSLRYFWRKKSPEQTAHDLDRVIRSYMARWHASSVALIGYSFGADVLPFVYNRLPTRERDRVALITLLGFGSAADFEIQVTGWLGLPPSSAALPERPEIGKVPPALVQCFYGENETDTMCPELTKLAMMVFRTHGGHHFAGDYEHLAHLILNGWRRRLTGG